MNSKIVADGHSTIIVNGHIMTMDPDDMALLNLPGRKLFGPMTPKERESVIMLLDKFIHISSLDEDFLLELKKTRSDVESKTFRGGPIVISRILTEYTERVKCAIISAAK